MKLYTVQVAPNPTRVNLFIAEKNAQGERIAIVQEKLNLMKGEQRAPEHLARTPFGSLPVLELDDGSFIIESLSIIEYLETTFPDPPLIGHDLATRTEVQQLERIAELRVLQPIGRIIHATNSPTGRPPNPALEQDAREALPRGLQFFEDRLGDGREFIAGDRVSIADCTMAAAFQFARFRKLQIAPQYKRVLDWDARYRERAAPKSELIM
ncbi:MAG: glutathione S-transferase family protein [Gammaproteobacteria bacterium]|nr:glutathione S-transferase family protein [Gammaproteobacteria bacterium]